MGRHAALSPVVRLFVGLPVAPDAILRQVADDLARQALPGWMRLVATAPAQYHVTLAFLGEQPAQMVPEIARSLGHACLEWRESGRDATFRVRGVGHFAGPVWCGLEFRNPETALALEELAEDALARHGWEADRRWQPHVTLGRLKPAGGGRSGRGSVRKQDVQSALDRWLTRHHGVETGWLPSPRLVLFESRPASRGTRHVTLARWRLSGPADEEE